MYEFIQARNFRPNGNLPVRRIVLHRMEAPPQPGVARRVARYFATTDKKASAHFCVDNLDVLQCVKEQDTAYHAPPNPGSVGIELPGYSANNDWSTPFMRASMGNAAALTVDLCRRHGIPKVWLTPGDLQANKRGITSHYNVSVAFGQSSHTDPGKYFPHETFMRSLQTVDYLTEEKSMVVVEISGDNDSTIWLFGIGKPVPIAAPSDVGGMGDLPHINVGAVTGQRMLDEARRVNP